MRVTHRVIGIAVGIVLIWTPAAAEPLQPAGKWLVEYGQDECLLNRGYGTDTKPLILIIRKLPMETDFSINVLKPIERDDLNDGKANVSFGGGQAIKAKFSAYNLASKKLRYVTLGTEDGASFAGSIMEGATLSIDAPGEVKETFSIPGFDGALHALDDCAHDLGRVWGIPIEQQLRLKKSAKALRHDYLQSDDYPTKELNKDESGRSQVRLTVDENGKPLDCVPLKSVRSPAFAQTACRLLLSRARFDPAIDVDGKPMRSIYVYTINWIVAG